MSTALLYCNQWWNRINCKSWSVMLDYGLVILLDCNYNGAGMCINAGLIQKKT